MSERDAVCVIIPTYNNASSILRVVEQAMEYSAHLIVVCDGSTDNTLELLETLPKKPDIIAYKKNRGKGFALSRAFAYAQKKGYRHAITLDADGQHYADEIPRFIQSMEEHPGAVIVGSRSLKQENMPMENTFANLFSNFWFTLQTFRRLPDTQTGYRLYPLCRMQKMRLFTTRYETELEILVRLAWRGVPIIPLPIKVFYAPAAERVSHFRKGRDFLRISLLNTVLTLMAFVYGYPSIILHKWFRHS
ncbi:MAG: glycosyltransferase family 2 protein [Bacteroidales bacterium]|nr:glycosyltransferase family 2 protein [Bacteroidales bacterium]MDD3522126.1 glycosyltransferase family 2 protein [Bacteroidales bacterium]MDD4030196.1 glycosyltransferase family 2 protein [Bacteroidales bacterium]MDD4435166.1 glycosyltransferase family 2 protein [Bacteroidales bacterium]MDD5733257.1 glycosyltransferase family 2 protein [Bacteroidales bacterium]